MGELGLIKDKAVRREIRSLQQQVDKIQRGLSSQSILEQGQQTIAPIEGTGFATSAQLASTDATVAANTALIGTKKARTTILGSVAATPINTNQSLRNFPAVTSAALQFQYPRGGSLRSLTYNMYNGTLSSGSATIEFEIYAGAAGATLLTEETYSWTGNFVGGVYSTATYASGVHTFSADDLMLMFIRFTGTFTGSIAYMGMQAELEYDD